MWKSDISPSAFYPNWDKLGKPNLVRMSLIECYWMMQNTRVTAFTISELLRENQHGGRITPTQIWVKKHLSRLL